MKHILLISVIGFLSACGPQGASRVDSGPINDNKTDLISYRDNTNKVTCYRVLGREGLSCLRDEK